MEISFEITRRVDAIIYYSTKLKENRYTSPPSPTKNRPDSNEQDNAQSYRARSTQGVPVGLDASERSET